MAGVRPKRQKPNVKYSTEYYVGFLGCLMDALCLERASLVGISMGGAIALGFGLRSPDRVERLVLVDSHGLGEEVPGGAASYLLVRLPLLNRLVWAALGRSRRMVRGSLRSVFYDPRAVTAPLVDEVYRLAKETKAGQAWRSWQKSEIRAGGCAPTSSTGCTSWRCLRRSCTGRKTGTCPSRGRGGPTR